MGNILRFVKKIKIVFCIFLILFSLFHKPQQAKAEALSLGYGLYLSALNPALLPVALIGLAAILILGFTITNWDDITAFGNAVLDELMVMGYSATDFVSGMSVKVDTNFKKAAKNAAAKTGESLPVYYNGGQTFTGDIVTKIGLHQKTSGLSIVSVSNTGKLSGIILGNQSLGFTDKGSFVNYKDLSTYISIKKLSASIRFSSIPATYKPSLDLTGLDGSKYRSTKLDIVKDAAGNIVGFDAVYDYSNVKARRVLLYLRTLTDTNIEVTSVNIPELGINKTLGSVSTADLKQSVVTNQDVDQYMNTAFPNDSTVNFSQSANIVGATLVDLPNISNHTLTDQQVGTLTGIQAKAKARARPGTSTGSISGATAVPGMGWLTDLWEWLKKLLNAILGIPAAILSGLKSLWDTLVKWLSDILTAIKSLGISISKVITDILTWAFSIDGAWLKSRITDLKVSFNAKFPAMTPINYKFADKETFDDLTVYIPNIGEVVIVQGAMVMKYSPILKNFIRAFFYLITVLFFFRRFYKVAED